MQPSKPVTDPQPLRDNYIADPATTHDAGTADTSYHDTAAPPPDDTPAQRRDEVIVIGGGPAGIASACYLQQAGVPYRVLDRAGVVASTWDSLYPSLTLNTTRFYSHMPGRPFPWRYGIFPTARQYHDYVTDFVAQHRLSIQLNTTVQRVSPQQDGWLVEASDGAWLVPAVISATGIYGNPQLPNIAGLHDFEGECYHSHDFSTPQQVAGKRVLVVGNGPSGIDIAVASGDVAAHTSLAIRTGVSLKRRYPLGLPRHLWLMLADNLPDRWCSALLSRINAIGYGDTSALGLLPPPPDQPSVTGYQGPELLNAVRAGTVHPVAAPVRFDAHGATLADGTYLAFDVAIMATGYLPVLADYLDIELRYSDEPWHASGPCDWMIGPNGQRGWPLRDTSHDRCSRQVLGYPGLYTVGTYYKGKGAMYNFNVEAEHAARQIVQQLAARPSPL